MRAQWQTYDGAVVVAIFEQWHVEYLLQRLELIFELLYVVRVVLKIEYGHVAAFVGRKTLVRIDEGHFVAAENSYEVGYVKEGDEFARLLRRAVGEAWRSRILTRSFGAIELGGEKRFRSVVVCAVGGRRRRLRISSVGAIAVEAWRVFVAAYEYFVPVFFF